MFPKEDCDDCTPSYARSLRSQSLAGLMFASIPFALTFLIVSAVVLQKLFPLLSTPRPSDDKNSHVLPTHSRSIKFSTISHRPTVRRVSAFTFSTTIALSAVLTELLLCEISNSFSPAARSFALRITVTSLLILLIVAIPLLELYSVISTAGWKFSSSGQGRLRLAWVLEFLGFTIYIVAFWLVGRHLPSTQATIANPENALKSLTEACLERLGFIGILLMALLSGFASVSSPWQTFGAKPRPISLSDISRKQAGLTATQDMLSAKKSRRRALEQKMLDAPSESFLQRAIGSIRGNADMQELKSLELEISGLETMEMSLQTSLSILQSRFSAQQRSATLTGRILNVTSHLFSLYCLYRIVTTSLSSLRRTIHPQTPSASSDPVTRTLALLAKHYDPTLDLASWSRQISFLLSGFILLASFSSVVQTFHFFTRFTPSILYTAQANLALLVAQVCGMYVISSALLLRSMTPQEVGSVINDALGTGVLEARWVEGWFEGWFLISVVGTAVGVFVGRKLGGLGGEWDETWDADGAGDLEMGKIS